MSSRPGTTFLLDANLSPKTARFLAAHLDLDVVSLRSLGLGEIPDHEVMRLARSTGRIIITLDEDFTRPFSETGQVTQGIIYLDLPNSRRYVPDVNAILLEFFQQHAASIDLDNSLVILSDSKLTVHHKQRG